MLGDLLDREALREAMRGCDAVVHLAAAADVDDVALRPAEAEAVNARGTLNVLEAARGAGVSRVVYASTIWVYGSATGTVDEDHTVELPDHLYTATKLAGEMYCRSYAALYGLDCTVLRFGIPYGPRARPAGVIPIFVRKALAGEPLTIAGEGLQSRRFVYVEDLAEGVVRGLGPQAGGRVYNLVGEESVTVRGIADAVGDLLGGVDIVHTRARAADFAGAEVSGARAAAELGWRPGHVVLRGAAALRRLALSRRRPRPTAPAPAAQARRFRRRPRLAPRLASLVLSWLTVFAVAGGLAAYLAAVRARSASRPRPIAPSPCSASARSPGTWRWRSTARASALWTFAGWALAAAGLVLVYMSEFREVLQPGGPRRVAGSCSGWPAARWPSPSPTRACACGARARSAWRPTGRSGRRPQSATVCRPARCTASSTAGSACAVRRHDPAAL